MRCTLRSRDPDTRPPGQYIGKTTLLVEHSQGCQHKGLRVNYRSGGTPAPRERTGPKAAPLHPYRMCRCLARQTTGLFEYLA